MNKVAIYARLSEDDYNGEAVSTSVKYQIKNLTEYARKNNMTIYNVYADDCYSGKDFNRPAFQQLLTDLKAKRFDTLLVKDISRIGRNLIKVGEFIDEICPIYNIRIIALLDNFDSFNDDSSDIVIKSFVNDYCLKECRKKKNLAIKKDYDANVGLLKFSIYGYDYHNNKLYVNKKQSKIVKWIFESYASGMPPKDIITYLKEHRILSPAYIFNEKYHCVRGNPTPYSWNRNGIYNIVKDTVYIGEYINGKCSSQLERKVVKGFAPPIVSRDLFDRAQAVIQSRSYSKKNPYHGLLIDKETGRCFVKRKTPVFFTELSEYLVINCSTKKVWLSLDVYDIVNNEVDTVLAELKSNKDYILQRIDSDYNRKKGMKEQTLKDLKLCEIEIKKNLEMFLSQKISVQEYKNKNEFLKIQKIDLNVKLKSIELVQSDVNKTKYEKYVDDLLEINQKDYPILAKIIFKKVLVTKKDDKIELEFIYNI